MPGDSGQVTSTLQAVATLPYQRASYLLSSLGDHSVLSLSKNPINGDPGPFDLNTSGLPISSFSWSIYIIVSFGSKGHK